MDEDEVIYKNGMSVRIKINKTRRNNSLNVYMSVEGLVGILDRDYTQYDKSWNRRFCVKVEGKHNPKSKTDEFWLYPEEVEIINSADTFKELLEQTNKISTEHIDSICMSVQPIGLFKNVGYITPMPIQSDYNYPCESCLWDDAINMIKENTKKMEEDKRKMELLEQIKNVAMSIISNYKDYLINKKNIEFREYQEEFLKTTEIGKICDKYNKLATEELEKLFCKKVCLEYSFENTLTETERTELKEKRDVGSKSIDAITNKSANLYSSIKLCETRDQVLEILKHIGLVDEYGVALQHDEVKTKHFD